MRLLKRIIDFYIYSNIHVALAGLCLTKVTLRNFGLSGWFTPVFVALSIIVSYNFIRFMERETMNVLWYKNWFPSHKIGLLIVNVLSVIGLIYLVFFTEFEQHSIVVLIPFVFMTFFYVIPIVRIGKIEVSFRNFPAIKIFSIAISWAGVTVFFPLYEANYVIGIDIFIEFIQRVLFVIAITIPFDIRDVNSDSKSLKSLPQVLGIKAAKIVGFILLVEFVFLELLKQDISNYNLFILLVVSVITGLFLWFSSPHRTRYYTNFWVESIPIVWFGIYVLI